MGGNTLSYQREFEVVVGSGSLAPREIDATFSQPASNFPVGVNTGFTGAHLLHLAVAGCVHNTVYQEASQLSIELFGVRICAFGSFDQTTWASNVVEYEVELDTAACADDQQALLRRADDRSVINRTLRQGAPVERWR